MKIVYLGEGEFGVVVYDDCFLDNVIVYNFFEAEPEQFYGCVLEDFSNLSRKMKLTEFKDVERVSLHIGTDRWYPPEVSQKIKDALAWFIYKNLDSFERSAA